MSNQRWSKLQPNVWASGAYRIIGESFTVLVGTSRSPHRARYTLYHRGVTVTTATSLADVKAIAEHHSRPVAQCPSGCNQHSDATR